MNFRHLLPDIGLTVPGRYLRSYAKSMEGLSILPPKHIHPSGQYHDFGRHDIRRCSFQLVGRQIVHYRWK